MSSQGSSYPVRLGIWTDWANGSVFGSTLTLTRSDGALLIALTAFFVAIVFTHLWRILCFILHNSLSRNTRQDVLHNQRQAALRNSSSAVASAFLLFKIMLAWRLSNTKSRAVQRVLPLVIASIITAVGSAVASGFSSRISQGNVVLIDGSHCGRLDMTGQGGSLNLQARNVHQTPLFEQAADYSQRCYESSLATNDCNNFLQRALPIETTTNASCPFASNMCLSQDSNIIVDTGLLDSKTHLGLNWRPGSEFQLQYQLHCAPLVTDGYRSSYEWENGTFMRYQYGDASTPPSDCNCTLATSMNIENHVDTILRSPFYGQTLEYSIDVKHASFADGDIVPAWSAFPPIPDLAFDNHGGDVDIIFLSGSQILFEEPSPDLWYRATTAASVVVSTGLEGDETYSFYKADEPTWPLGCVQKYQLCSQGQCTGLGTMEDTKARFQELGNAPTAFFDDVYYFKLLPPLRNIFTSLGRRSLASRLSMAEVFQAPLGPNGWHKDIYRWLAISMSYLQFRLVETTMGPSFSTEDSIFEQFVIRPPENETQQFCHSQKIRSTNYTSFSMFWLIFTFVVGMLVIVAANTVESVLHFIQRTFFPRSSRYHRLEWRAGQALHLQRLAHNELEPQEWKQGFLDVPVTAKITSLAVLDADVHVGLPCIVRGNETILSDESETKDSKHVSSHLEVFEVNDHSQEFTTDARPSFTKDGVAKGMRVAEEPKDGNHAVSRETKVQDNDEDLMETGSVQR